MVEKPSLFNIVLKDFPKKEEKLLVLIEKYFGYKSKELSQSTEDVFILQMKLPFDIALTKSNVFVTESMTQGLHLKVELIPYKTQTPKKI